MNLLSLLRTKKTIENNYNNNKKKRMLVVQLQAKKKKKKRLLSSSSLSLSFVSSSLLRLYICIISISSIIIPNTRILLLLLPQLVECKKTSGTFKLSGVNTEYVVGKFAISSTNGGVIQYTMRSTTMYENDSRLRFHIFQDIGWDSFYLNKSTCTERIRGAIQTKKIVFSYNQQEQLWISTTNTIIPPNSVYDIDNKNNKNNNKQSAYYYYFVIDDCSLEEYYHDMGIPKISYDISMQNYEATAVANSKKGRSTTTQQARRTLTHLSMDEVHLWTLHIVTLVLSSIVTFLLIMNMILTVAGKDDDNNKKKNKKATIHVSLLCVTFASMLDAASSICELIHIHIYHTDGIGSYIMDAVAAHLEAVCDTCLILLLLSIAAGWTLPTSVITLSNNAPGSGGGGGGGNHHHNHHSSSSSSSSQFSLQSFISDLSKPFTSFIQVKPVSIMSVCVLGLHVILAQWGRTYNDDFESYHDLEHIPGMILMFIRVLLGLLFVCSTIHTSQNCKLQRLTKFYQLLGIIGFLWFISLPLITITVNIFVSYHLRHPTINICTAFLQSISIMSLAWLVTTTKATKSTATTGLLSSSSFHEVSHISNSNNKAEDSFTDQLLDASSSLSMGNSGSHHNRSGYSSSSTTTTAIGGNSSSHQSTSSSSSSSGITRLWNVGPAKIRLD